MNYIDLEIGSNEWLEYRKKGIGASESSAILGKNPWKKPFDVWEEKIMNKKTFVNSAMKRGIAREEEARVWFEKKMGVMLMPKMIQHPTHPWKYATLDGIDLDEEIIVEIKWANSQVHSLASSGIVVEYYYPQVQSQIACSGLDMAYFLSCHEENGMIDFQVVEVKKDEEFINRMIEQETMFYNEHLLTKTPPPKTTQNNIKISVNEDFDEMCRKRSEVLNNIKTLEREVAMYNEMISFATEGKEYRTKAFEVAKIMRKGAVEYKDIPELKEVDIESYRKEPTEVIKISEVKNPE